MLIFACVSTVPLLLVSCIGVFIAPSSVHSASGVVWSAIMTARITRKVNFLFYFFNLAER